MVRQLTLDNSIFRPKVRYYEKSKTCDWLRCPNNCYFGSNFCSFHSIYVPLNFGYGILEFIIPQEYKIEAHEYFKKKRRVQFEIDKKRLLKIYPNGKLF